ncbi:uncharacterized protein yc1106_08783 [Curvularia clavata]|uniref:Transmembrane protein n=1 Tax=Curvularia clavata TaxID=95742 RepID=A0A9Q8ZF33_CURCL|nr:uncharacterized protein yc1106_08783 [Curvularia clavata]
MPPALQHPALAQSAKSFIQVPQRLLAAIEHILITIATLPYYRLYHFNTLDPIRKLAQLASTPSDSEKVHRALSSWRERKLRELQFTTISCTVLAAAVIGAFSWTTIADAYWLTHGFWHMSLILAILGILLSASEVTVLDLLGPLTLPPPSHAQALSTIDGMVDRYRPLLLSPTTSASGGQHYVPRRKMVFTWQAPVMFMSYSVCAFLGGLTILVCTPFIRHEREWGSGHNIAVMYLTAFVGGVTAFAFCSFWVYHYVDVGHDDCNHNANGGTGP